MAYWREIAGRKYIYATVGDRRNVCVKSLGVMGNTEANQEVSRWETYHPGGAGLNLSKLETQVCFEQYLTFMENNGYSPRTIRNAKDHVTPFVATVPKIKNINESSLKAWNQRLIAWTYKRGAHGIERKLSSEGRAHKLRCTRSFVGWLVKEKFIDRSPWCIQIPAQRRDAGRALTDSEVMLVLEHWPVTRVSALSKLFYEIMLHAGTRVAEVFGSVEFEEEGLLHENVKRDECLIVLEDTKNGEKRHVAIPREIIEKIPQGTGPVFFGRIGNKTLQDHLKSACKAAGITGRVRVYDGRVTSATKWASQFPDNRMRMDQFGWSDPKMAAHYTKVSSSARAKAAQAITYKPA